MSRSLFNPPPVPDDIIRVTSIKILEVYVTTKSVSDCRQCLVGVTTAAPIAFLLRGIRSGFCDENIPAVSDLVEDDDDALFERTMRDEHHVLRHFFLTFELYVRFETMSS